MGETIYQSNFYMDSQPCINLNDNPAVLKDRNYLREHERYNFSCFGDIHITKETCQNDTARVSVEAKLSNGETITIVDTSTNRNRYLGDVGKMMWYADHLDIKFRGKFICCNIESAGRSETKARLMAIEDAEPI
jgi:hypothetical protein